MITGKNIFSFVEGYTKMLGDQLHLLPDHEREQVLYRGSICRDECVELGYCVYCGCDIPAKLYVNASCNGGERFPDMMNKEDWKKFKEENGLLY